MNILKKLRKLDTISALKAESANEAYLKLVARSVSSVPFQLILFIITILRVDQFRADPIVWAFFGVLIVNSVYRYALVKMGPSLLKKSNGLKTYRILFTLTYLAVFVVWQGSVVYLLKTYGLSADTVVTVIAAFGTAATMVMASLDLPMTLFMTVLLGAGTMASLVATGLQAIGMIAVHLTIYVIYQCVLTFSFNKLQIKNYQYIDELEEKDREIRQAHESLRDNHEFVRSMLDSIDQAFLVFDSEGKCIGEPSNRSIDLLEMNPAKKSIAEVLRVPEHRMIHTEDWFKLLFSDRLDFSSIAAQGPKSIELAGSKKVLKVQFHPMRGADQKLDGVIFTATDITAELESKKKLDRERERAEMILRINENKSLIRPFLTDVERVIHSMTDDSTKMNERLADLRRELHTIKGTAMMFGANELAGYVFACEIEIRNYTGSNMTEQIHREGDKLRQNYIRWKHRELNLFTQLGVFDEDMVEVSKRKLRDLGSQYANDPQAMAIYEQLQRNILSNELGDLLKNFEIHAHSTAVKLKKKVSLKVQEPTEFIYLPLGAYRDTLRSLVHLVNNSVDHGIELPADRIAAGKAELGTISISYDRVQEKGKSWIRLTLQDDGRGINTAKLKASLMKKGARLSADASELDIAMRIFDDGLSTSDSVSEISGQGVGMGSVRSAVLKVRGSISILKTDSTGTTFEIKLPDNSISTAQNSRVA